MAKRIDSTLRGRVGLELSAVLQAGAGLGVVVPAAPSAGRVTVGGMQYVDGILLSDTEVYRDPFTPVTSPSILDLLEQQGGHHVTLIPLKVVREGARAVSRALDRAKTSLVVVDAATDADIVAVARACRDRVVLPVDPGPFTAALMDQRFDRQRPHAVCPRAATVLVIVGSRAAATMIQAGRLVESLGIRPVPLDVEGISDGRRSVLVDRLVTDLTRDRIAVLWPEPAEWVGREPGVVQGIAEVAGGVLERQGAAVVVAGGDTTVSVCRALEVAEIDVVGELAPLCAVGIARGGVLDGMPIVTKGGMVGGVETLVQCVRAVWGDAW
jgi:uncharacterized protein YgbK (DUF1537 family)